MATDSQQLQLRYSALSDGELLSLATARNDLTPEAGAALDEELSRRHLTSDDINKFAESLREADEPPPNPYADQPLPPQELPEDFFEERQEVADAPLPSRRLKGITFVAMACWLGAVLNILIGVGLLQVIVVGLFYCAYGLLLFVVGTALFRLRRWGYRAAVALYCINAGLLALGLIVQGVLRLLVGYRAPLTALAPLYDFLNILYSLVILGYLLSPKVRDPARWN